MRHEFIMKPGTQKQIVRVFIRAATAGTDEPTGLGSTGQLFSDLDTAGYIREGASAAVAITPVTAAVGTFTSSGFIQVDATNMPGWYEFGVPDACLANGAQWVDINLGMGAADDAETTQIHIDLVRSVAW